MKRTFFNNIMQETGALFVCVFTHQSYCERMEDYGVPVEVFLTAVGSLGVSLKNNL